MLHFILSLDFYPLPIIIFFEEGQEVVLPVRAEQQPNTAEF